MSESANPFPAPELRELNGVRVLMAWPVARDPDPPPAVRYELAGEPAPALPDAEFVRVERLVARLGALVGEVLAGRRAAAQLQSVLDDESAAMIAAWARLGVLRPQRAGAPRLSAVDANTVEGWVPYVVSGRAMAATVSLSRLEGPWRVTHLRLVAPEGAKRSGRRAA